MSATPLNTFAIQCDHIDHIEPNNPVGCPQLRNVHAVSLQYARDSLAVEGWTSGSGQDFCPEHS